MTMGIKNIQGELRVNDEIVATQDWVTRQNTASIIATFNITEENQTITLKNLEGITKIDWGDGIVNNDLTHTYEEIGEYICKIYDVTGIGNYAFDLCRSLRSIIILDSVTSIGGLAFHDCINLTSVTIPDSVTSIGNGAFSFCSGLTSVMIGDGVTTIGVQAFLDCSGLTSVMIGDSVTSIGSSAFSNCSSLISIKIPDNITSISSRMFYKCSSLMSIVLSNSVTNIGEYAFEDCIGLTSIEIPASVTSIEKGAFFKCSSLTEIVIPNGVTSIGEGAFNKCSNLTSIVVSESVTSIGEYAFGLCDNLISITFKNMNADSYDIIQLKLDKRPALTYIYVPYGCKQAYIDKWTADGATQDILDKIVESDREAMMSDVNAFKTEIQEQLVSKTDYLGTVTDIPDFPDAGAGDYCRVSAEFIYNIANGEVAHIGDILIAVSDNPTQSITDWDLVHTELNSATLVTVDGEAQVSWEANTKLDKVTSTDGTNKVYVAAANGSQTMVPISSSIVGNAIVQRTSNGYIRVPSEQVDGNYAVSQTYVADNFVAKAATPERVQVYAIDTDGNPTMINTVTSAANKGMIPIYGSGGTLNTGYPVNDNQATNGYYVKENFIAKSTMTPDEAKAWTIPQRTYNGRVIVGTPEESHDAATKKYVDDLITIVNTTLEQSGIVSKYKATIEDTYSERVTADGANVLDGGKAKIEKVVGSTVACKNLLDVDNRTQGELSGGSNTEIRNFEFDKYYVGLTMNNYYYPYQVSNVSKRGNGFEFNSGSVGYGIGFPLKCKPNTDYSISWKGSDNSSIGVGAYTSDGIFLEYTDIKTSPSLISTPEDCGILSIVLRGKEQREEPIYIYDIMLNEGSTALPYQPYFTGLKSASFGGIESTNADGTETATLNFPKTETPLGTTIDFENKKITDYGYTIVLTGEEVYSNYNSTINGVATNGVYVGVLPNVENNNQNGVTTDGVITTDQKVNRILIGAGNKILYWVGILDILGFTTAGTQATGEDARTAVANFKAWLAQRYANGNPVTIRYISSTLQNETDFSAEQSASGNEYTAYKGGTEKVLDNDGKDYGAENTLSQNYIIVTEVK